MCRISFYNMDLPTIKTILFHYYVSKCKSYSSAFEAKDIKGSDVRYLIMT